MLENKAKLKVIGEADFRELFRKILYIQPTEEIREFLVRNIGGCADTDGFLVYCHIDNQEGLSFDVLCQACIKNGVLTYGDFLKKTACIIRRGALDACGFVEAEQYGVHPTDFCEDIQEYLRLIDENYECKNEQTKEMREFTFLDPVRSSVCPDDIQILLYQDDMRPEMVWAKCYAYTDKELFALLLNEPNQDFGVHKGDVIGFSLMNGEKGLLCVYTGRWLERLESRREWETLL